MTEEEVTATLGKAPMRPDDYEGCHWVTKDLWGITPPFENYQCWCGRKMGVIVYFDVNGKAQGARWCTIEFEETPGFWERARRAFGI